MKYRVSQHPRAQVRLTSLTTSTPLLSPIFSATPYLWPLISTSGLQPPCVSYFPTFALLDIYKIPRTFVYSSSKCS